MSHPQEDDLLLLAYGELDDAATADVERHLADCAPCREKFVALERSRIAVDWAATRSARGRRAARWAAVTVLAAAAGVAGVLLTARPPAGERPSGWPRPLEWSTTAGYLAGGPAVITIDAQLTRLEQEWSYVHP
jgi:anti-sigma factor RsiW